MPRTVTDVDLDGLVAGVARTATADDTDHTILRAAAALLEEFGLVGVEMDAVAAAAGVGRSTLYRRFTNRNDLLAATVVQVARSFFAELAAEVAPLDDLEDRLVAAFCAGLRLLDTTPFGAVVRDEPLLLRLVTVDGAPLLLAAVEQLVGGELPIERATARAVAELLVRLAISFLVTPTTTLALDPASAPDTIRRHLAPLLAPALDG